MTARLPQPQRRGAAVLGSPIAHSLSPTLHRAAYDALGLHDWDYRAIECAAADLAPTLGDLAAAGCAGASLTMPLKRAVMPLVVGHDHWSRLAGAANTVTFADDGWHGANTDVPGLVAALRTVAGDQQQMGSAAVLGAGATAASALAALADLGCREVVVVARREAAAVALGELAAALGLGFTARPWGQAADVLAMPLVVSTAPAGAVDHLAAEIADATSLQPGLLFDVVYSPWPTPLARAWSARGGRVVGGLELLVEQAALQVELFTGRTPPVAAMRQAGYAALERRA